MKNRVSLIYLLGAGRSGTTLLATLLNNHEQICTIGEMHQFIEHLISMKNCSCGDSLDSCPYWAAIVRELNLELDVLKSMQKEIRRQERHRNIIKLLISKVKPQKYLKGQNEIFRAIQNQNKKMILVDSSKYIARYLLLKRSNELNIKGVYLVRDVRGLVNSFNKEVQTRRAPLSTIIYYLSINFFGQIVCWLDKEVIKIKYENLIEDPLGALNKIYSHGLGDTNKEGALPPNFAMPHIIGGNRMKSNKKIVIHKDLEWKTNLTRPKQILYYLLSLPYMVINNYRL